jgi:hypothetical protein
MDESLQQVRMEQEGIVQQAESAYRVAEKYMLELKQFILSYTFKDQVEEIQFYKNIEPSFHARLIYFVKLYGIERRKPVGGIKVLKAFFEEELNKLYLFFRENEDFYQYYRSGSDFMDETLFLPDGNASQFIIDEYSCILNNHLCTAQGYKVACILAFEQLQTYLNEQVAQAEGIVEPPVKKYDCKWTGSKVALTELMYALVYSGMINNGHVQVKELADVLENTFQTKMGNYYRTRQEMYSRKETASFLELLIKRFRQGMDEADERFRS